MKKFLLTAVLIVAVLTSLTAGTLAAYNQTLSVSGTTQATHFEFVAPGGQEFSDVVELNPGKSQDYRVVVTNNSDVPVAFVASAAFGGTLSPVLEASWDDSTSFNHNSFTIEAGSYKILTLNVKWGKQDAAGADARDVWYGNHQSTANLTLSVNGSYVNNATGTSSISA